MSAVARRIHIARIVVPIIVLLAATVSFADEAPPVWARTWGTAGSEPGQFGASMSISMDYWGDVFIGDADNNRIQVFNEMGDLFSVWGSAGSGEGEFDGISGVAADAYDYLYVADHGNLRVQKFTSSGGYMTEWSTGGTGLGADAGSYVYVANATQNRIEKYDSSGNFFSAWGSFGSSPGQFNHPSCVAVDPDGYVYVGDEGNYRIQKFYPTGGFVTAWGEAGAGSGQFGSPLAIATDPSGNVYVADGENHRIQKFAASGDYLTQWGTDGSGPGQFGSSLGVAGDRDGNIVVADSQHSRVQVFYPAYRDLSVESMPIVDVSITGSAAGLTPFSATVHTGDTVTLTAPSYLTRSGVASYFVRWYLNGNAMTDGRRTLTFEVGEAPTAIAYYKNVEQLRITGHTAVWERSLSNYRCTAYFTDGSVKTVTALAKWRDTTVYLTFPRAGLLKAGTVPRSRRRSFTARYGGVTSSFSLLIRNR